MRNSSRVILAKMSSEIEWSGLSLKNEKKKRVRRACVLRFDRRKGRRSPLLFLTGLFAFGDFISLYSNSIFGKMTIALTLFVVGAVLVPGGVGLLHRCPPSDGNFRDFYIRCNCTKSQQYTTVSVTCQEIATDEMLLEVLFKLRNYTIDSFVLKRSGPLTFGSNPFRKLNIHKLVFEDANFATIPIFRAFTGLEYTLEELHFVRCTVGLWSWGQGRNLVYLNTLRFEDTRLPETLTDELVLKYFPNKIRKLQINGCSVKILGNDAFRRFTDLEQLELNNNGIVSIQRSMFPPTARRLKHISLKGNPLVSIADDTFVNMTRLEFLTLSNTRLTSLRGETFLPVWDQLEEIYFNNIHLNCTCDSKWMLDMPNFKTFRAPFCNSHGKTLVELNHRDKIRLCGRRRR